MPPKIFKPADAKYLVTSLSTDATHAGISTFEIELGMDTASSGDSKHERALKIIKKVLAHPDTDMLIIEMLDQLYARREWAMRDDNETFQRLKSKVLDPRGVRLADEGFVLPDGRGPEGHKRTLETEDWGHMFPEEPQTFNIFDQVFGARSGAGGAQPEFFGPATPGSSRNPAVSAGQPSGQRSTKSVFVVHGRDMRPVQVLKQYLVFLGLRMMPWSEAVALTDRPQPHTYDVVRAGMDNAAAIIVIFSPDDLARVKDDFSSTGDPDRKPQGQSRQNVTLEAGMAYALAPERTIFLKSGDTREISDIAGFNWVKLDGLWESRDDLKKRLEKAGAAVSPASANLADDVAGPFVVS